MLVERTAFAADGRPVEISRDVFRGDRTRIVWESEIGRDATRSSSTSTARSRTTSRSCARSSSSCSPSTGSRCRRRSTSTSSRVSPIRRSCGRGSATITPTSTTWSPSACSRYRAAVGDGSSMHEHVREAVRYAAERVPLAICSGAARAEIEPVVEAAGSPRYFRGIVSSDDVVRRQAAPGGLPEGARAARRPDRRGARLRRHGGRRRVREGRRVCACSRSTGTLDPHRLARGRRADRPHRRRADAARLG